MGDYRELSIAMENALQMNEYNEFFSICNRGINSNFSTKEKAQIYFIMASTHRELNELTNALKAYSSAINLDKDKLYAYVRKAEILRDLGRIEACDHCCLQGLKVFPNDNKLLSIKQSVAQSSTFIESNMIERDRRQNSIYQRDNEDRFDTSVNEVYGNNINELEYEDDDEYEDYYDDEERNNTLKTVVEIVACIVILICLGLGGFFGYKALFVNKAIDNKDTITSSNKDDDATEEVKKEAKEDTSESRKEEPKNEKRIINNNRMKYLIKDEDPSAAFSSYIIGNPSYIFPESDRIKLKYEDVINKTLDELFVARNEIFARFGYMFEKNSVLDNYFRNKPWYKPSPAAKSNTGNEIEASNSDLIRQVEVSRITHYNYGENGIDGYVIEDSNTRKINRDEIKNLKDWEIIVARNEIFARHGLAFSIPQLDDHFSNQTWYKKGGFNDKDLTSLEVENIDLIKQEENSRYNKILKR